MNKKETAKLLAVIQGNCPTAYRDLDKTVISATINIWHDSFDGVPYFIMEWALGRFWMTSRFAPTIAEMVEELRHLHYQADEYASIQRSLGNEEAVQRCLAIMRCTDRYKDPSRLGEPIIDNLMHMQMEAPADRQAPPQRRIG